MVVPGGTEEWGVSYKRPQVCSVGFLGRLDGFCLWGTLEAWAGKTLDLDGCLAGMAVHGANTRKGIYDSRE